VPGEVLAALPASTSKHGGPNRHLHLSGLLSRIVNGKSEFLQRAFSAEINFVRPSSTPLMVSSFWPGVNAPSASPPSREELWQLMIRRSFH